MACLVTPPPNCPTDPARLRRSSHMPSPALPAWRTRLRGSISTDQRGRLPRRLRRRCSHLARDPAVPTGSGTSSTRRRRACLNRRWASLRAAPGTIRLCHPAPARFPRPPGPSRRTWLARQPSSRSHMRKPSLQRHPRTVTGGRPLALANRMRTRPRSCRDMVRRRRRALQRPASVTTMREAWTSERTCRGARRPCSVLGHTASMAPCQCLPSMTSTCTVSKARRTLPDGFGGAACIRWILPIIPSRCPHRNSRQLQPHLCLRMPH